jgi:hypothetical protein
MWVLFVGPLAVLVCTRGREWSKLEQASANG